MRCKVKQGNSDKNLSVTQPVQQVQMSPKLLINDYFDIIMVIKYNNMIPFPCTQRIMVNHDFQGITS